MAILEPSKALKEAQSALSGRGSFFSAGESAVGMITQAAVAAPFLSGLFGFMADKNILRGMTSPAQKIAGLGNKTLAELPEAAKTAFASTSVTARIASTAVQTQGRIGALATRMLGQGGVQTLQHNSNKMASFTGKMLRLDGGKMASMTANDVLFPTAMAASSVFAVGSKMKQRAALLKVVEADLQGTDSPMHDMVKKVRAQTTGIKANLANGVRVGASLLSSYLMLSGRFGTGFGGMAKMMLLDKGADMAANLLDNESGPLQAYAALKVHFAKPAGQSAPREAYESIIGGFNPTIGSEQLKSLTDEAHTKQMAPEKLLALMGEMSKVSGQKDKLAAITFEEAEKHIGATGAAQGTNAGLKPAFPGSHVEAQMARRSRAAAAGHQPALGAA